jgi:16S rRNA (uracil1498-N3)-methyltransferase
LLELRIDSPCDLLIGPEGGFSDREITLIKSYQLRTYSLGSQILRNQTAAILSTGIVSLKMQK